MRNSSLLYNIEDKKELVLYRVVFSQPREPAALILLDRPLAHFVVVASSKWIAVTGKSGI